MTVYVLTASINERILDDADEGTNHVAMKVWALVNLPERHRNVVLFQLLKHPK